MRLKKSLSYSLILCSFLSSCAGQNPKLATVADNTIANTPAADVLGIRGPSSSMSEENLNNSFDIVMSSKDPEKEFLSYLNLRKKLYLRAEAYLADFDRELNEADASSNKISLEDSKPYKKLMAIRSISERSKDKLIFFYLKLGDIIRDKSANRDKEKVKLAVKILKNFNHGLKSNIALEKIAYDDFKIDLAMAISERRRFEKKSFDAVESPVSSFKNESEKIHLIRQYREKFRLMGKDEQSLNDELNQTIDDDADKLKFINSKDRSPQSLMFYPSVGGSGNVMGLVFPKNVWALTYDDGPNPVHTPAILKNLESLGIKATFFWLAQNVIRYQAVVDLVKEKGMVRANHSWSHAQLPKLSDEGLKKEIIQSTEVETKSFGEKPLFFRCPYGAGNSVSRVRKMIADLGMIHVFWNVDSLDWQDKDSDSILARTQKQMKAAGHGVVLFHDIHPQSVIASKKLVEWTKTLKDSENKIRWVTLPEIVKELNGAEK